MNERQRREKTTVSLNVLGRNGNPAAAAAVVTAVAVCHAVTQFRHLFCCCRWCSKCCTGSIAKSLLHAFGEWLLQPKRYLHMMTSQSSTSSSPSLSSLVPPPAVVANLTQ